MFYKSSTKVPANWIPIHSPFSGVPFCQKHLGSCFSVCAQSVLGQKGKVSTVENVQNLRRLGQLVVGPLNSGDGLAKWKKTMQWVGTPTVHNSFHTHFASDRSTWSPCRAPFWDYHDQPKDAKGTKSPTGPFPDWKTSSQLPIEHPFVPLMCTSRPSLHFRFQWICRFFTSGGCRSQPEGISKFQCEATAGIRPPGRNGVPSQWMCFVCNWIANETYRMGWKTIMIETKKI